LLSSTVIKRLFFLFFAALFWAGCPAVVAQTVQTTVTGTIAGKITAAGGNAISGATVTAVDVATGHTRTVTTDKDGAYELKLLTSGTYDVRYSAPGYKTTVVNSLTVNAGDILAIDQALSPGPQAEEVVVPWVAPAPEGTANAPGTGTDESKVKSLPLSSRNYTEAAGLAAGVSSQVTNATAVGINTQMIQVGGGYTNNYVMDGVSVASSTLGAVSPGIPNPDVIQANDVQSWTYDAGSGRYAGANISVVTKSGSNAFHGTLFEFVRNDIFNSNDYFLKREGFPEPVLKQNQFGVTIGGPIRKNKLNFFGSYQGTRQRNGIAPSGFSPNVTLPPLPATRTAASVGAMFCGDTGYFGGVPIACDGSNVNPVALNILNLKLSNGSYYIPGSSNGGYQTVPYSIPAKFQEDQFLVNTDYKITGKNTIAERFFYTRDPQLSNFTGGPPGTGSPGGSGSLPGAPSNTVTGNVDGVVKLTSTMTANLSNEMRISGQHYLVTDTPILPSTFINDADEGGVGIASLVPTIDTLDIINITGLFNLGGNGALDHISANQYQWADQISWTHGGHTIRSGIEVERRHWNVAIMGDARGSLNFMSFPDFLLGLPGCPPSDSSCTPSNPNNTNGSAYSNVFGSSGPSGFAATVTGPDGVNHAYRFSDAAAFVQDGVKLTSRLTLDLGVRWEYFGLLLDTTGNLTNFWPSLAGTGATGTYQGFVVPSNFKGVMAAGVTRNARETPIPIGAPLTNFTPRAGFAWQPLASSGLVVRGGYGFFYDRPDAFFELLQSMDAVPYATPIGGSGAANYQASLAHPYPPYSPPYQPIAPGWGSPRTASSNLTLRALDEQFSTPLTQKWNLEIVERLPSNWTLAVGYAGAHSVRLQSSDREINESILASAVNPMNGITTNTEANATLRAPYLGIAPNGLDEETTDASAKYNSLQATLVKQLFHGAQVQAAYMFSKTLSNNSAGPGLSMDSNDPLNARQQYGPSFMTSPQRLALNYSWNLPYKGAGMRGKLLGDWSLSGMTIIQDGPPMTLTDNRGGTVYGNAGNSRAQFCPGMGARNAATPGGVEKRLNAYFNTTAFCGPPVVGDDGEATGYGNSSVGFILGPGQDNTDLSVNKSIAMKETKIELRVELFNAFNHPQFVPPDSNVTDAIFGVITGSSVNPRLIQFAVKYSF
jgi:hypothetical protein